MQLGSHLFQGPQSQFTVDPVEFPLAGIAKVPRVAEVLVGK
jgi:hypothetical protein